MRDPRLATLLCALALLLLVASGAARAANDAQARILIVFPEKLAPSGVHTYTKSEVMRGALFGPIVTTLADMEETHRRGVQLDATLQGYDRYEAIYKALEHRFAERSSAFAPVESRTPAVYLSDKGPTAAALEQGYDYVLNIEDRFSGLSTLTVNVLKQSADDLAPLTIVRYQVYDAHKRTRIAKGAISAYGLEKHPYEEALHNRDLFVGAFPAVADSLAKQLVGELARTDQLHAMAESVGRGNEVPQIGAVLKRFEKRFEYRFDTASGWRHVKMSTPYAHVLEPKSDLRLVVGLRFDVDLLVPELGQDVRTLDEYVAIWQTRLGDQGFDLSTFTEFKDIHVPDAYRVYSFNVGSHGGRQIVLLRQLNDTMVEMVTLVFLKDFDTLYPQNRAAMEQMIAAAKLTVS